MNRLVFCPSYPQTPLPPCPCWSSTSSWAWWRAVWWRAGAAGPPAGSCGVSASAASYPAATRPAPPASSAPTAKSTDWPKSPRRRQSTGPQQARRPTAPMKTLPRRQFRAGGPPGSISSGAERRGHSALLLSCDQW